MENRKPNTQKETIDQLWFAIIGSNGEGLIQQFRELKKEFHDFVIQREESCPVKKREGDGKERKWSSLHRWTSVILFSVAVATFVLDKII